jgi:hypothetical protein
MTITELDAMTDAIVDAAMKALRHKLALHDLTIDEWESLRETVQDVMDQTYDAVADPETLLESTD